jgi:hypothetical protein
MITGTSDRKSLTAKQFYYNTGRRSLKLEVYHWKRTFKYQWCFDIFRNELQTEGCTPNIWKEMKLHRRQIWYTNLLTLGVHIVFYVQHAVTRYWLKLWVRNFYLSYVARTKAISFTWLFFSASAFVTVLFTRLTDGQDISQRSRKSNNRSLTHAGQNCVSPASI